MLKDIPFQRVYSLQTLKGISAPTEMSFFSLRSIGTKGVLVMLPITFYKDYKSWARKLIKVKAHTRKQNGKVVKVRSYYRSVWGR